MLIRFANLQWRALLIKYIQKSLRLFLILLSSSLFLNPSIHAQDVFEIDYSSASASKRTDDHSFPTLDLIEKYKGEEKKGVLYLNAEQRESYRVYFCKELLCDQKEQPLNPEHLGPKSLIKPFSNTDQQKQTNLQRGLAIYVMNAKGEIWLSFDSKDHYFHHSTLLAGQPIAAAGEMIIFQGKLYAINNQSGHYQPPPIVLKRVLSVLENKGVSIKGVLVKKYGADF